MSGAGGVPGGLRLLVHVQPRAARNRIFGWHGNAIKVQVHAPPEGGAANAALVDLLAEALALPRRAVRVLHGRGGRDKVVEIDTPDPAACRGRLDALLAGSVDKKRGRD